MGAVSDIIAALNDTLKDAPRPVVLHEPLFSGREKENLTSCINSGWVSSAGEFVDQFESDLKAASGARYAVATVNGTCALHAALTVMGVVPGDEVLVPALTFAATANAVSHAGAIPHFVDIEEASLGIDPQALQSYLSRILTLRGGSAINKQTGRTVRAIVPVHLFGHPCQIAALRRVAGEYGLHVLEDAAAALGSISHGQPIGANGTAIFSFNGNKIITTGGGGAVVTDDEALYRALKHLTTTAKQPHSWAVAHDAIGWNYRMPNVNAALGCAQLAQLPQLLAAKRALAKRYMQAFSSLPGMRVLAQPEQTESNYWLVTLLAENSDAIWLDDAMRSLHDAGYLCRPAWTPLHQLPMYRDCPRSDLAVTEALAKSIISLPSSAALGMAYA